MTALLLIGIVVVVLAAAVRDYAPRPGEREAFRQAALRARHSLTDWGEARIGRCHPEPVSPRFSSRRGNRASIESVDI
ncbi:hypothetical protein [Nocardia wallacei]|uniref:hypothetical protein n=1 Tax=Nocardia wallacei TaxID=480035 RepID=UPI002453ABC8|nr:hypothetical protein [Nocardia wallacei]